MQEGGQTVNTIPSRTQIEMYVRAKTVDAIFETEEKVNRSLKAGAMATAATWRSRIRRDISRFTRTKI